MEPSAAPVRDELLSLQDDICRALEEEDGRGRFRRDEFPGERGGLARPRGLEEGVVFEKAAVNFSHTCGESLPTAATARRPELAGRRFEAVSISLITHPRNPLVPTSHMNVRYFCARREDEPPVWWFGGGFDLTPCYGFEEDAIHWHRVAKEACAPFGEQVYPRLKRNCDEYFFLPHRKESRGIGGVFFDDWCADGFESSFGLMRSIGRAYLPAYLPIVQRRRECPYGEREREFQLWRRGRYAEFNLVYDRGTRFGLQSGGRIESILASLPPLTRWKYDWQPEPGSAEAGLAAFLQPRDWLARD